MSEDLELKDIEKAKEILYKMIDTKQVPCISIPVNKYDYDVLFTKIFDNVKLLKEQNAKLEQQKQKVIDYIKNIDGVIFKDILGGDTYLNISDILEILGGFEE